MVRRALSGVAVALGILFAAPAAAQSSEQPPRDTSARLTAPAPPSGSIQGRVLAADSGRAVKRARILATAPELPDARAVMTADDGSFALTGLPAGRYSLRVSKPGFIPLQYGQRRPQQAGTPLQLGDGQMLKGVEFRLPRGGVISGRIADENGDPLVGAAVRVLRYEYSGGQRRLMPAGNAQTDDRGEYRVWGLNPGTYYVTVLVRDLGGVRGGFFGGNLTVFAGAGPDDAEQFGYAPTYYPGTTTAAGARPVTVGLSQEVLGVDFGVQLLRTSRINGRVLNPDGSPTSSGNVIVTPDSGPGQLAISYRSRIDWDGAFTIARVPPGRYIIRARGDDADTPQFASAPVGLAGGDVADVNLVLAPSASIAGTVVFEGQQGAAGDPSAIRVSATPMDAEPFGPAPRARVDDSGRFVLDGIPPGAQLVRPVSAPSGWALESVTIGGRNVTDVPIDVRAGEKMTGAVVTFTNQLTRLSGTISDDSGAPLTEYTVLAFPTDTTLWHPLSRQIMTARPDQNGSYRMRGLPPGDYYLAAVDPTEAGQWFEPAFLDQQRAGALRVSLKEGESKTQNFKMARP